MSRILDYIAKYDENLTISQLKTAIKQEQFLAEEKETEEENRIKANFENKYLKVLDKESLFGTSLNVYHFNKLVRKDRCTDWSLTYYFSGEQLNFTARDIFHKEFNPDKCGNSFSEQDLKEMTVITEAEYFEFKSKYESITEVLEKLIAEK